LEQRCSAGAKRPFVILGGTRWDADAALASMRTIAEAWLLPVGCSFRRQMLFDHLHPNYAGDLSASASTRALGTAIKQADLVLLMGGRMSEMPSSGLRRCLRAIPTLKQTLVHIHRRCWRTRPRLSAGTGDQRLALRPSSEAFAALQAPHRTPVWSAETTKTALEAYLDWSTPAGKRIPGRVQMGPRS
jgi:acetolactate synthase-1/2/3 large subunit